MKNKNYQINILIIVIILPFCLFGQNKIPLISGKATFSVERGTIECDLTLSEYSHIDNYFIRLNAGLNILNIQSVEPQKFLLGYQKTLKDTLASYDETNSYYFPSNNGKDKFLPNKLRFKYIGKYPVIKDTINFNYQKYDWRGNVAFNNHILRVDGYQSGWYPLLYDIKNDYQFSEVRYDIEIECSDCEVLYINGNLPKRGNKVHFKSDVPREMFLFLGNYNIQKAGDVTLLNTNFNKEELQNFSNLNSEILGFLKDYTKIGYYENIFWIQGNITSKHNAWSFISYPTFITCGYPPYDLKSQAEKNKQNFSPETTAHELSHYYFGTLKNYNNVIENIIDEGFSEFISIKYLENKGNKEKATKIINNKLEYVNEQNFLIKPIGQFQKLSDTNDRDTYAYDYLTLLLLSIEKQIGKDKMKTWIQLLLKENKPLSDFIFLKKTLKKAIQNEIKYNFIVTNYLLNEQSIKIINLTLNK